MEPQIRFCTTSDGVRIAYSVLGSGPMVIRVPPWISHVELDWQSPISRPIIERLAQHFTYVRFDKRGTGLSDREAPEVGVEAHVRDLQAVVDHFGAERFALTGQSEGGPACIVYAAEHPERVTRMVLSGTFARDLGSQDREVRQAFITIVRNEWGMGSKILTEMFFGPHVPPEAARWFTQYQRAGATAEVAARMIQANYDLDVTPMLQEIECPVLVIHGRHDHVIPFEAAARLRRASVTRNSSCTRAHMRAPTPLLPRGSMTGSLTSCVPGRRRRRPRPWRASEIPPSSSSSTSLTRRR